MSSLNYSLFNIKCPQLSSYTDIKDRAPFRFSNRIGGGEVAIYENGFFYVRDNVAKTICDGMESELVFDRTKSWVIDLNTKEPLYNLTDQVPNFNSYYRLLPKTKDEDKALGYIIALDKENKICIISCHAGLQYAAEFLFYSNYFLGEHLEDCGNSLALSLWLTRGNKWMESYIRKEVRSIPFQVPPKGLNTDIIDRYGKAIITAPEDDKFYISEVIQYKHISCSEDQEVVDDLHCLPLNTKMFIGKSGLRIETRNFIATKAYLEEILGITDFTYIYIGGR